MSSAIYFYEKQGLPCVSAAESLLRFSPTFWFQVEPVPPRITTEEQMRYLFPKGVSCVQLRHVQYISTGANLVTAHHHQTRTESNSRERPSADFMSACIFNGQPEVNSAHRKHKLRSWV